MRTTVAAFIPPGGAYIRQARRRILVVTIWVRSTGQGLFGPNNRSNVAASLRVTPPLVGFLGLLYFFLAKAGSGIHPAFLARLICSCSGSFVQFFGTIRLVSRSHLHAIMLARMV